MIKRRVLVELAKRPNGATVLDLCELCVLWAADVVQALDELVQGGWVERRGELFFCIEHNKPASVNQTINAHLARLNEKRE